MQRLRVVLAASLLALAPAAFAQRHHRRHNNTNTNTGGNSNSIPRAPVAVVHPVVGTTEGNVQPRPTLDLGEVIPVPVTTAAAMLRRMKVYLFNVPPGNDPYAIRGGGEGRRLWALLPSCQPSNNIDHRDPCPVDRVAIEAVIRGNVNTGTPTLLGNTPDARRLQAYVVNTGTDRVRIRVLGPNNSTRYEAVVEAERLEDLQPPQGTAVANGFDFDYLQYPAR